MWAVAAAVTAVALRVPLEPWLEGRLLYVMLFPVTAFLSLRWGMCAGLIGVAAYMLLAEVFLVDREALALPAGPDLAVLIVTIILAVSLVLICSHSRALRLAAQQAALEAHRAQERVRCSEERFRLATRAARDVIYDLDIVTGQIEWNEALDVLGYADRTTDLRWWEEHIHPEDRDRVSGTLREAFTRKDTAWQAEYRFRRSDGEYAHILDRAYLIYGAEREPARLVGAMVDVTESRASTRRLTDRAEALTRSNRDLEDFAYIVSHDLKEPLRGISALAGMLLDEHGENLSPLALDRLEMLQRLPRRMSEQMDALLEFSRLGRTEFSIGPTNLKEVVIDVVEQLSTWLCDQHAIVAIGELPTLRCDPVRVQQIFHNLVVNAVKYSRTERKRVEVDWLPGTVPPVLLVRDNGIGIAPQHHAAIFTMFRRLHPRDHYGGGAGAGLALVKKIVDRHGGQIWVDSTPGHGATFKFTLAPAPGPGDDAERPAVHVAPDVRSAWAASAGGGEAARTHIGAKPPHRI